MTSGRTYALLKKIVGASLMAGAVSLWIYIIGFDGAPNPKDAMGGLASGLFLFLVGVPLFFWADE